jgi:hypothetical protein
VMTMRGTWQTTSSGGGGMGNAIGAAVTVAVLAVLAVKVAGQAGAAVGEMLRAAGITVGVIAGMTASAGVGLWVWRRTHRQPLPPAPPPRQVTPARAPWQVDADQPRQLEAGRELHLHLHDVSAEDVAAILRKGDER